ncbi:SMI1/KNR4 family protein [Variovorax sp. RB2P76]|uniref:SMI1/KNR4 family protein n=1 Tax=Variovorax sp. RB2P76 TaxID=3443736 RepID=UPI003F455C84
MSSKSNNVTGALRIVAAMTVVVSLMVAGYLGRSPWIVVLATPALTLLYALGKFRQWQMAWRAGGVKSICLAALIALPVQLVLGYVFYLLGRGLASLVAPAPIDAFGAADVLAVGLMFLIGLAFSLAIIKLEENAMGLQDARTAPVVDQTAHSTEDVELDMDPRPLTPKTFFKSPGYWRPDPLYEALEGRGKRVAKPALAASDAEIAAAEERTGFRLPESLRALYRMLDGGYVGALYVPLKMDPGPVYDDWRGAFSIDYSSLSPLKNLRTVRAHYEDFTDDPDDMPAHADTLLVLQARYGDMTLLDYSRPGDPQVSIVDFDRNGDLADISFESFDDFFLALRRPKEEKPRPFNRELFRSKPLGDLPRDDRATAFWGYGNHPFVNMAKGRDDGWHPKDMADKALIDDTEARIGAKLPEVIKELWRARNGGDVAYRFLEDGPDGEFEPFEELAPLEYAVTLAELSRRIDFAIGETPWHESIAEADKLVVLNAKRDALVLLDFRREGDPSLLVVDDFGASGIDNARAFDDVNAFVQKLRKFERSPLLPSPL